MSKIRVIVKQPFKELEVKEIENTLTSLKEIVDGYIECVPFPRVNGVDLIVNEEGKLDRLDGNFYIPHYEDCIVGTAIITSYNKDGEFISLNDDQIKQVSEYINHYKLERGQDIYEDLPLIRNKALSKMKRLESEME